jgi:hypothetical protein
MGIGIGIAIGLGQYPMGGIVPPHPSDNILLEAGDNIMFENGTDAFLLES